MTHGEAFTVQPFGNSLVTMTLSTQDVKDFMEGQFAGCLGQSTAATRFALPSAGFKYHWDGAQTCWWRISNVTLRTGSGATASTEVLVNAAGVVLNPTKTYRVTVNNFMSTGGDGYTTLIKGTNRIGGSQDIDALTDYFAAKFKTTPHAPGANAADVGTNRIIRSGANAASRTCPSGADTNS